MLPEIFADHVSKIRAVKDLFLPLNLSAAFHPISFNRNFLGAVGFYIPAMKLLETLNQESDYSDVGTWLRLASGGSLFGDRKYGTAVMLGCLDLRVENPRFLRR